MITLEHAALGVAQSCGLGDLPITELKAHYATLQAFTKLAEWLIGKNSTAASLHVLSWNVPGQLNEPKVDDCSVTECQSIGQTKIVRWPLDALTSFFTSWEALRNETKEDRLFPLSPNTTPPKAAIPTTVSGATLRIAVDLTKAFCASLAAGLLKGVIEPPKPSSSFPYGTLAVVFLSVAAIAGGSVWGYLYYQKRKAKAAGAHAAAYPYAAYPAARWPGLYHERAARYGDDDEDDDDRRDRRGRKRRVVVRVDD